MDGFPSGQREQTVNLSSQTSMVRIHPHPPLLLYLRKAICGYGGIGRRVRFRSVWAYVHAGSTPVIRTKKHTSYDVCFLLYFLFHFFQPSFPCLVLLYYNDFFAQSLILASFHNRLFRWLLSPVAQPLSEYWLHHNIHRSIRWRLYTLRIHQSFFYVFCTYALAYPRMLFSSLFHCFVNKTRCVALYHNAIFCCSFY